MKYKIKYSPEALKDLDEIWEYILLELANPDAAEDIWRFIVWRRRQYGWIVFYIRDVIIFGCFLEVHFPEHKSLQEKANVLQSLWIM